MRFRDEIFVLRDRVAKDNGVRRKSDDEDGNDRIYYGYNVKVVVITSTILKYTIVPAMKDLLKGPTTDLTKETNDDDNGHIDYTIAILECLLNFVAATCALPELQESPTQKASYNSLSFRRASKKEKSTELKSDPNTGKDLFVESGAFEMVLIVLRKILEYHVSRATSASWSRNKRADLDTLDSIGVADSTADVKIESTWPKNQIPALAMHLIACLTHNANDFIKTNVVLPYLTMTVHKSMMIFLPSEEIQAYGCWTLYSLSNPLLQELITAGSLSVLVRAMKCHPTNARVQEYGNKSLYNLLHLLLYCTNQNDGSIIGNQTKPKLLNQATAVLIEIDGEKLEDYTSLIPALPAIVLKGMETHPNHLAIQQYGLLVLTRLCQQDQETFEVIISEGGLMTILNVVIMATKAKLKLCASNHTSSGCDDPHFNTYGSFAEKYDCVAQMACQFLRDISRPTNSSMDIIRILAVKGGLKTVLKLLDHYNQENLSSVGENCYGNSQRFAIINIIDPAMACLRNLMTNEHNRKAVMACLSISKTIQKKDRPHNPYGDDDEDGILICSKLIHIVLKTMDNYPLDAPVQAYGSDLLGRLAHGEQSARIELIQTTIFHDACNNSDCASRNPSEVWKAAEPSFKTNSVGDNPEEENRDVDIVDLCNQQEKSGISNSVRYVKRVDALATAVRSMRNHRNHQGVQERTVTFLLAMVVDRDAIVNRNEGNSDSQWTSSFYLIQRLEEVYDIQKESGDPATFLAFLQSTSVPPKGIERLKTVTKIVDDYDRKKTTASTTRAVDDASNSGLISNFFRSWNNKQTGGQ